MTTTSHQICIIADLTYRQVDFWTRAGYLTPIEDATPGTGHTRTFDDDQVALAVQMSRLTKVGLPANVARHIALDILTTGRACVDGYQILPVYSVGEPLNLPNNVRTLTNGEAA